MENRSKAILGMEDSAFARSLFKSMGYTDSELKEGKPLIGIANTWNTLVPGHYNLDKVAEYVKNGIYAAGGTAVEFGTIAACDGVAQGHEGMHYILPSREIICDSVEIMAQAHRLDGLVLLASCDKIVPAMLMAAARLDIPCIVCVGGPMLGGIEFDVPVRMSFDDPTQDLHIHYQPGLQHLTGEDVLKVARCRNNSDGPGSYPDNLYGAYPDGDIGRTRTQQQLIAVILKKALSNPQKINSYVNLFLEYVDTDLEFSEALWFAQPALGLDFSTGFASATLAGENVYYVDSRGYRWGSCYELDPEAALETVNSLINPYNAPLTAADLNIFQKP